MFGQVLNVHALGVQDWHHDCTEFSVKIFISYCPTKLKFQVYIYIDLGIQTSLLLVSPGQFYHWLSYHLSCKHAELLFIPGTSLLSFITNFSF